MRVGAIVLAAGESRRMGQPKMSLAWGKTTVLGQVIRVLRSAGVQDVMVITGAGREGVEKICEPEGVRAIYNAGYGEGEMLVSLQVGLQAMLPTADAALVTLGDQPQIEEKTVRRVVQAWSRSKSSLIVPSHQKRRGHPWLVGRVLWQEILALRPPETPRDFLNRHASEIEYLDVDSGSILADLDTPDDYLKLRP